MSVISDPDDIETIRVSDFKNKRIWNYVENSKKDLDSIATSERSINQDWRPNQPRETQEIKRKMEISAGKVVLPYFLRSSSTTFDNSSPTSSIWALSSNLVNHVEFQQNSADKCSKPSYNSIQLEKPMTKRDTHKRCNPAVKLPSHSQTYYSMAGCLKKSKSNHIANTSCKKSRKKLKLSSKYVKNDFRVPLTQKSKMRLVKHRPLRTLNKLFSRSDASKATKTSSNKHGSMLSLNRQKTSTNTISGDNMVGLRDYVW